MKSTGKCWRLNDRILHDIKSEKEKCKKFTEKGAYTVWSLAVVQDNFNRGDTSRNVRLMESYIVSCARDHPQVKLILFPELATTGYRLTEKVKDVAEYAEGPTFSHLSALAQKFCLYIGYGFVEKGGASLPSTFYNSMNFIGPNGERLATYQKIHLTPLEEHLFTPGRQLVTVDTEMGRFGLLICWDLAFPELSRLLALEGADVLLAPSAWEVPHDQSYRQMASARALDNVVFVATCNHTGRTDDLKFFGKSAIYGPDGRTLNEANREGSGLVVSKIDLGVRQQMKEGFFSMWRDRRNDLYDVRWKGN